MLPGHDPTGGPTCSQSASMRDMTQCKLYSQNKWDIFSLVKWLGRSSHTLSKESYQHPQIVQTEKQDKFKANFFYSTELDPVPQVPLHWGDEQIVQCCSWDFSYQEASIASEAPAL